MTTMTMSETKTTATTMTTMTTATNDVEEKCRRHERGFEFAAPERSL